MFVLHPSSNGVRSCSFKKAKKEANNAGPDDNFLEDKILRRQVDRLFVICQLIVGDQAERNRAEMLLGAQGPKKSAVKLRDSKSDVHKLL